jgi:hypothetical protein
MPFLVIMHIGLLPTGLAAQYFLLSGTVCLQDTTHASCCILRLYCLCFIRFCEMAPKVASVTGASTARMDKLAVLCLHHMAHEEEQKQGDDYWRGAMVQWVE